MGQLAEITVRQEQLRTFQGLPRGSWAAARLAHGLPVTLYRDETVASRTRWCTGGSRVTRLVALEYLADPGSLRVDRSRLAGNPGHRRSRRAAFFV